MRFSLQDPHVDGFAVIDRERHSLVMTSLGDHGESAREALESLAACLNAATDPNFRGSRETARS